LAVVLGAVALTLLVLFYLVGGWHFSNLLDERALDADERRSSASETHYDFETVEVSDNIHPELLI
jgi:hypothetical protein